MKLLHWILLTCFLAIILHIAFIWYAPALFTRLTINVMTSAQAESESMPTVWNNIFHRPLKEATDSGFSFYTSPDTVYSFAPYDVSQGSVRIHCVIPEGIVYWSISFYDMTTHNFFVENNQTAQSNEFDLILASENVDCKSFTNKQVIISSTKKGMIFIRAVISDRNDKDELERITAAQKASFIEPVLKKPQ